MTQLESGTKIGPYEIVAPIGAGGMGEVYRARDPRLGRDIALKVLPAALASHPERLARFEREAKTVAALNHPNIVTIHSIEEAQGIRFITMELVEGQSLDQLVAAGTLPLKRVLELALALAGALEAAHQKGIVHRDLKPANVMLTSDERVKVLDFGLAKPDERTVPAGSDSLEGTQALTMETPISTVGNVVGTVPYMSPEQVRGEPVDARSDLFSLGIMLYELSTGQRPFGGKSVADVTSAILRDTPPPIQAVRPELPPELGTIIGRCLEKERERRYQAAQAIGEELDTLCRLLESGSGSSPNVSPAPAAETPSIAVLPFTNMSADAENEFFSDGLSEELLNVLARNPGLKVTGRTSSFAFKGKHEDLREIGQKLGVSTLLEGSVRKAGNRVRITAQLVKTSDGFHLWSENFDRVLDDIFAVQDDIARAVSEAMNVTLLGKQASPTKLVAETYELVLQANHLVTQHSEASFSRAITLYRQALDKAPDDARAWAGIADAYLSQAAHGYAESRKGYMNALDAVQRALELDDMQPKAYETLGWIRAAFEYRWAEAGEAFRRGRSLAPGDGGILVALASFEATHARLDEALSLSEQAAELDPLSAVTHLFRARIQGIARQYDEAIASLTRALELSPGIVPGHAHRAVFLALQGNPQAGLTDARAEASEGYRSWAMAAVYHTLGDAEAADQALAALIAKGQDWAFQIATVCGHRGDIDQAFEWLDKAYFLRDPGVAVVKVYPLLESLHGDPRWPRFLKRVGLSA